MRKHEILLRCQLMKVFFIKSQYS